MNFATLLAVALALPRPWYPAGTAPESDADQRARIEVIVRAAMTVAEARPAGWPGTRASLAAALLAVTYFESRWSLEVHDGRKRGDRDPRTGIGRACGLGQLWGHCEHLGTGLEVTQAHLVEVAEVLARSAKWCRVRLVNEPAMGQVLTLFGTGKTCTPATWTTSRIRLWSRLQDAAHAPAPLEGIAAAKHDTTGTNGQAAMNPL